MITSDSTVQHLADSFQGLPDAHTIVKSILQKSKEQAVVCPGQCERASEHEREREREREREIYQELSIIERGV